MSKTILLAAAAAVICSTAAQATVTTYTSASAYAAAVSIAHRMTFEGLPESRRFVPIIEDGISVSPLAIDLYITRPGEALERNSVSFPTTALTADGDENFEFRLTSGASFGAIGMDYATNKYGPPVLSLYTPGGALIGSFTVPLGPETVGFFGLLSTTPIGYARSIVDRGYIADTAVDNIRIGTALPAGVPEPETWALMFSGFGVLGLAMRRRGQARVAA